MSEAKELRKREYANRKEQGTHDAGKPIEPKEGAEHHSGRGLPSKTVLSDSKIIKGKLAKRDE